MLSGVLRRVPTRLVLKAVAEQSTVARRVIFPFGEASYESATRSQMWLADRTPFIPRLLDSNRALLFRRPWQFGKTMTVDMLAHFLDVRNHGRAFGDLFGHTWIGTSTETAAVRARDVHAGRYMVLRLDMSGMGDFLGPDWKPEFDSMVTSGLDLFRAWYGLQYDLVVLIDGCGQGAPRSVFPRPEEQRSQLEARGRVLQGFYETLKSLLGLNLVERVILTGVAAPLHSQLGIDLNVALDVTSDTNFERMCGLDASEVREGVALALLANRAGTHGDLAELKQRARAGGEVDDADVNYHTTRIQEWFSGSQFSPQDDPGDDSHDCSDDHVGEAGVRNPQSVNRYLHRLHWHGFVGDEELEDDKY